MWPKTLRCHQLGFVVSDGALHMATVQLVLQLLSLRSFSSTPDEGTNNKRKTYPPLSYEILPNPLDTLWPSHYILKISFENNHSNQWKTYPLTDLSSDLTFWAKPQRKQKAEAKACRGSLAVCACLRGQHWLWQDCSSFPMLTSLLS